MTNYDFLVAVVRDRGGATNLNASLFLMGAFVMFLVAMLILLSRSERTTDKAGVLNDERETVNREILNPES